MLILIDESSHAFLDHDDTKDIQAALDKLKANSGGTLRLGAGIFNIGSIQLYSNTTLELSPGCKLLGSPNIEDYKILALSMAELSHQVMIYSKDSKDVRITGTGQLLGNSESYFAKEKDDFGYKTPHKYRPRLIVFENCEGVHLDHFTISDAPMWTTHLVSCKKVFINNLTIDNSMELPNTDALDIDSCQHVFISNCFFSAADDAICIKTTNKSEEKFKNFIKETRFVTISNCTLRSKSCALKIGTETFYDVTDMVANNVIIYETNRAIGFFPRDGGSFKRVNFTNFSIQTKFGPPVHWGKADPICITVRPRIEEIPVGTVEDFTFSNFSIVCSGPINLFTTDESKLTNISFNNINMKMLDDINSTERCLYDIRPPINPDNPNGMGVDNAYCINPMTGLPFGVDYFKGGMPGIYLEKVSISSVKFSNVKIVRPEVLPEGWSKEEVVFAD